MKPEVKPQFDLRASTFEDSAHWVRDPQLMAAHIRIAGKSLGKAVDICCGTGVLARALHAIGWDVTAVDINENMVQQAAKYVKAVVADAKRMPFQDQSIDLAVLRQAYYLLDNGPAVLREIRRILKPGGKIILSHLVPYGETDREHLKKIHTRKQAGLKNFYTSEDLTEELERADFTVTERETITVRESVSLWMRESAELVPETRQAICEMVTNAPPEYKRLRNVQVVRGEILENWNFVLLAGAPRVNS